MFGPPQVPQVPHSELKKKKKKLDPGSEVGGVIVRDLKTFQDQD